MFNGEQRYTVGPTTLSNTTEQLKKTISEK